VAVHRVREIDGSAGRADGLKYLRRQRAAVGIGEIDEVRAAAPSGLEHLERVRGALREPVEEVFGAEADLLRVSLEPAHGFLDQAQVLVEADPKRDRDVMVPGLAEDVE